MDFNQLSYFIAIARHGNFSAAARQFYVSQPCISHQIQMMEKSWERLCLNEIRGK